MKKNLFAFLMMTLVISASSDICFANGDGPQAYAEEQARIAAMSKPVVYDHEYPQWGFQIHSWITGTGSETTAHTQLIDMASGTVFEELEKRCSYTDPTYDTSNN